jgi:hypothetical protein
MCNNSFGEYEEELDEALLSILLLYKRQNEEIAGEEMSDDNLVKDFKQIIKDYDLKKLLKKRLKND